MEGVELMKYHWETVKYAEGGVKKKFPIYLLETADSTFSTKWSIYVLKALDIYQILIL